MSFSYTAILRFSIICSVIGFCGLGAFLYVQSGILTTRLKARLPILSEPLPPGTPLSESMRQNACLMLGHRVPKRYARHLTRSAFCS